MSHFAYRSLSFHGVPRENNHDLIRLGAQLGFTDVTVQLEGKNSHLLPLLSREGAATGLFELLKELGLTLSVWTHEISDPQDVIGPLEPDNEELWQSLRRRYTHYMTELLPEVDFWVLTVVETEINLTERRLLQRLVKEVCEVCRQNDRQVVLRTFVHEPEELEEIRAVVGELPDDVIILSKYVPQDWHLRAGPDPLVGQCDDNLQWVELDICGEYYRNSHLANCLGPHLEKHFAIWQEAGIAGISVRVDRRSRPGAWWEPMVRDHSIWGTPQEFNLFALAHLTRGSSLETAWKDFSRHYTGQEGLDLQPVLDETGKVVEEALCVGQEPFGGRTDVPCEWSMNGEHTSTGETRAVAYPDEDDEVFRNPFHAKHSAFRWNHDLRDDYHRIRRGDPEKIRKKAQNRQEALAKALQALDALEQAAGRLKPAQADFLRFLLEENLWHLDVMYHSALAWMKASARLYGLPLCEQSPETVEDHLAAISQLAERQQRERLQADVTRNPSFLQN